MSIPAPITRSRYLLLGWVLLTRMVFAEEFPDELQLCNGATLTGHLMTLDATTITFATKDGGKTFAR